MFSRIFRLSESETKTLRVLSAQATLPQSGKGTSWVTVTRTGSFTDPRYGRFEITPTMLSSMVANFEAGIVGQDVFLDVNHKPGDGSAAKILKLSVEGNRLRALVEWTDFGVKAVKERGFTYLSAEFADNWQDNEAGAFHGPTLLGAGLTVRPVIKRLDPITLSCESGGDVETRVLAELADDLLKKAKQTMNKWQDFLKKLADAGYSAEVQAGIKKLGEALIDENTPDDKAAAVIAQLEGQAKQLAAAETQAKKLAEPEPEKKVAAPAAAKVLSEDDVAALVAKKLAEAEQAAAKKKQARADAEKLLSETIAAEKGLDDELKKQLSEEAVALLPEGATEAQVKALAQHQITMGNRLAANKALTAMGYQVAGTPHITVPDEGVKQLSEIYTDNLKKTGIALTFAAADKLHPFTAKVLSEFDRLFARELNNERKLLAGTQTDMANANLPYGVQREVIKEALSDLNVLNLVQTLTDFSAQATVQVPYEERELGAVMNDGMVFEGQAIPFAGITQRMDTAFVNQMKLALVVTNEVVHFTRSSLINWDALARNIQSNARILRELVARRIMNEIQRASDAFNAVAVSNESITATASTGVFKTAQWPVVRPHQVLNLQGAAVGEVEHPLKFVVSGAEVKAFDGSGAQSAGTYYRIVNLNQGVFQLVDQTGQPKTGAATITAAYSRASNIAKFDIDLPVNTKLEEHLNGLLRLVGAQKAMMNGHRYRTPDYLLMSPVLNDQITNASEFIADHKRNGTDTTQAGDLLGIKNISAYGTNAPNTDLGDDRVIMGQRGLTTYTVVKPFATGELIELTNGQGQPLGKKAAYGEEYNSIYTPKVLRGGCTSIVVYSATARAAL